MNLLLFSLWKNLLPLHRLWWIPAIDKKVASTAIIASVCAPQGFVFVSYPQVNNDRKCALFNMFALRQVLDRTNVRQLPVDVQPSTEFTLRYHTAIFLLFVSDWTWRRSSAIQTQQQQQQPNTCHPVFSSSVIISGDAGRFVYPPLWMTDITVSSRLGIEGNRSLRRGLVIHLFHSRKQLSGFYFASATRGWCCHSLVYHGEEYRFLLHFIASCLQSIYRA